MLCPGRSYNPECSCCQGISRKTLNTPRQPAQPVPNRYLRWLPYFFAAGGIFWLVQLTQAAALAAAPVGRDQMVHYLMNAGFTRDTTSGLTVDFVMVFFFEIAAVVLHGTAYYGFQRARLWGRRAAVSACGP